MDTPPSTRKRGFKLEFPGDDTARDSLRSKFQQIKQCSSERLTNSDVINKVLDFWISSNIEHNDQEGTRPDNLQQPPSYQKCEKEDANANIFLCTHSSVDTLIRATEFHSKNCSQHLVQSETNMRGGVTVLKLKCDSGHIFSWTSSPHLPNGKFVANTRFVHSYLSTGMLPNQFERLSKCLGFSCLEYLTKTMENDYKCAVESECKRSCETAIMEEITNSFDNEGSVDIMTDARHGHRKNAKDTNVICLGQTTHKVMKDVHVTKDDDKCTQRHELLGTKRLYDYFDSRLPFISGPVNVRAHAHDRNSSVNKYLREERPEVINQNDTWHAGKSIEKQVNKIARGANKNHGQTWHREITDKVLSVRTHVQYAIRNCNGDADTLRAMMDNVTEHYQNNHEQCRAESRCKWDQNYEPSKQKLRSPAAIEMLKKTIQQTDVYRFPQNYVLAMDTFYVESFNNVLNIFLDKRINFTSATYEMRTNLAILHWNENVDRSYTSVNTDTNKKILKKRTLDYREQIWDNLMDRLYV